MTFVTTYLIVTLVVAGLIALGLYLLGEAIKAQGRKYKFFATLPDPGKFMFEKIGGLFNRMIENVVDWDLDSQHRFKKGRPGFSLLERLLGVTWIGLYGEIAEFEDMEWVEFRQKKDAQGNVTADYAPIGRKKSIREFLQQFTYVVPFKNLDLKGNIQASGDAHLTVYILDPLKAYYTNKNWVDQFVANVQAYIKGWSSEQEFDNVKNASAQPNQASDFAKMLREANGIELDSNGNPNYNGTITPGGLYQVYGIVIWNANMRDFEPTPESAALIRRREEERLKGLGRIEAAKQDVEVATLEAAALDRRTAARKRWVHETVVEPTGGPGQQVAEVLVAEHVGSKDSKVQTWVQGDRKRSKAMVAIPTSVGSGPRETRPQQ